MTSPTSPSESRRLASTDYETLDRRYTIAVNLECWELMAMRSIANNEVLPLCAVNGKWSSWGVCVIVDSEIEIEDVEGVCGIAD